MHYIDDIYEFIYAYIFIYETSIYLTSNVYLMLILPDALQGLNKYTIAEGMQINSRMLTLRSRHDPSSESLQFL